MIASAQRMGNPFVIDFNQPEQWINLEPGHQFQDRPDDGPCLGFHTRSAMPATRCVRVHTQWLKTNFKIYFPAALVSSSLIRSCQLGAAGFTGIRAKIVEPSDED